MNFKPIWDIGLKLCEFGLVLVSTFGGGRPWLFAIVSFLINSALVAILCMLLLRKGGPSSMGFINKLTLFLFGR